ncbi:MAG: D-sedoheptulose 7-phosphate isomerase [Rhodospirillales bacterium]|jgi:D-sedoheptulose 7-phosphate isomerase|nr:D-sedoheptulose 7-phosphate isomerase [Rhodospirillales bacterium]MBT4040134.1 D-sedoheptulose 7-phosphate isomerase [Rhodospirillales bacterium]MBT4625465.1 D-sedoheptulose 7-phosphate isomerase [Rhodospirillales bacterium]MBT5352103.1 D-sedoheptulose 7-phosphate isomerase [Rhodospirillales bacterium]MBT5521872.1 D-sedoheptulose 7-phosphate isomerase [Rhodospirillales bacterium]
MDLDQYYNDEFEEHIRVANAAYGEMREPLARLVSLSAAAIRAGGKIVFCGNGGSAADCQHLATELTIRYLEDRSPIAAIALTTDTSTLTAAGNDIGFESIFSRQVEALCSPHDVVIGFSTSGNSTNIIKALEQAKSIGCIAAGFGGRDGGKMVGLADPFLIVPSNDTPRIQEMHITLGHMLCGALEMELGLL